MTTREIETFQDTPLKNTVEGFELLQSILTPFNITLDDALIQDGGERTYTFKNSACGTLSFYVLSNPGEMPALSITAEKNRPVMLLAMDRHQLLIQKPRPKTEDNVVFFDPVVRVGRELLEWIRTALERFFRHRYIPAV